MTPGPAPRRALALLALAVFLLHFLVSGGHLQSPDEELLFRTAESIAHRGSTSVAPLEYDTVRGQLLVPAHATFATRQGRDGRFFTQYLPLQPLLAVPLVWLADATAPVLAEPFAARAWPTMASQNHGADPAEFWRRGVVVLFFNPILSVLSALALARIAASVVGSWRAGLLTAVLWAFGTIGWAHAKTFFTEPLAGLFGLLALERLLRWHAAEPPLRMREALWMGAWLALGVFTRVDFPFVAAGLLGVMGVHALRSVDRAVNVRTVVVAGACAAIAFAALQGWNGLRFGGGDVTAGYGDQSEGVKFTTPLFVGLQGLLGSPGKGMFFFSPALLVAAWGWMRAGREASFAKVATLVGFLPFFIAMAKWQNWEGGWCWGPRHIVQIHLPLMLGAAFVVSDMTCALRRWAVIAIGIAGVCANVLGTSQSPTDYYHEFYRTPQDGVYFPTAYRPDEVPRVSQMFRVTLTERPEAAVSPARMPAPIANSLYIPQESQWFAYPQMLEMGYLDWYFFRVLAPRESPDLWSPAAP